MTFTVEQIMADIENWVVTGKLDTKILASNFEFSSPYWEHSNRQQFIHKFFETSDYLEVLTHIVKFDSMTRLTSLDGNHFTLVFRYFTKNGCNVWETVWGRVENGLLVELRSIYDLAATKKAHEIE